MVVGGGEYRLWKHAEPRLDQIADGMDVCRGFDRILTYEVKYRITQRTGRELPRLNASFRAVIAEAAPARRSTTYRLVGDAPKQEAHTYADFS